MSERDDELPEVPGAAADADSADREARIDALLTLSSTAPASLDANIAARRAAGDRVILPVDEDGPPRGGDSTPVTAHDRRRPGLTLLLAVGLAAAAAALLFMRDDQAGSTDPRTPSAVAGTDTSAAPVIAGRDTAGGTGPTVRDRGAPPLAPPPADVALGFERTQAPGASFGARLERFSAGAIDSTVAAATRDPAAPLAIGYPATSTELAALAERIERELVAAGIAPARIVRAAYPATTMRADVTITVGGGPQQR